MLKLQQKPASLVLVQNLDRSETEITIFTFLLACYISYIDGVVSDVFLLHVPHSEYPLSEHPLITNGSTYF
jgi:hypothetical protein